MLSLLRSWLLWNKKIRATTLGTPASTGADSLPAYRSMCRSFLFPTSMMGTLSAWEKKSGPFFIPFWNTLAIQNESMPRRWYSLNFPHHVQQFFVNHLDHFKAARKVCLISHVAGLCFPRLAEVKHTFYWTWRNRPGCSHLCLWSTSEGRWSTHPVETEIVR